MSLDITLKKMCYSEIYSSNITHNMVPMANAVGIYGPLWRPHACEIKQASQLIKPLTEAIALLKEDPEKYKKYNPENGWGSYDSFLKFLINLLDACIDDPTADVEAYV